MAPYERCGSYVLLRELSRDALGSLHRAGHVSAGAIDRLVLLRTLTAPRLAAEEVSQHALAQQDLVHQVRSPYLGELLDAGACRGEAFLAYEYQPGVSARRLLALADDRHTPLPPDLAAVVADRAAQAVMALYAKTGQGHGLLVPELLWISSEGETRLLGTEAAALLRPAASGLPALLPFLSPEARGGASPTELDEVWSLGALLATLMSGSEPPPDDAGDWLATATAGEDGSPLPEPIAELLGRSLVPRAQRLSRVEAWHQALARALELVGWRTAPFQLAVFMHSLLKSEMKREPSELEREREEALRPTPSPSLTPVLAPTRQAAAAHPEPPARPGSLHSEPAARPVSLQPEPAARLVPAPRLLGALGKDEEAATRRARRGWLPWVAVAGLALAGGIAFLLLRDRAPAASGRMAAAAAATATPVAPAVALPTPAVTPLGPSPDLEQRLTQLLAEREKSLSDRYAKEVEELRGQLAESRRVTAAQQAALPSVRAEPPRTEVAGAEPARPEPLPPAGAESAAPPTTAADASTPADPPRAPAALPNPAPALPAPLVPPRLLRFEPPEYPALARRRGVEGTVVLSLLVAVNGQVSEVRFVRRVAQDVGINEAAEAAARRARFQPATRGGVPAEAWYTLTIPFQL